MAKSSWKKTTTKTQDYDDDDEDDERRYFSRYFIFLDCLRIMLLLAANHSPNRFW